MISGIAQGAGFSVAEESKEEWNPPNSLVENGSRNLTVRIVRPLRDVGIKECALWAWWCGLPLAGTSTLLNDGGKHGIGSLTRGEFFIHLKLTIKQQPYLLGETPRFYIWFRNRLSRNCLYDCTNLC